MKQISSKQLHTYFLSLYFGFKLNTFTHILDIQQVSFTCDRCDIHPVSVKLTVQTV